MKIKTEDDKILEVATFEEVEIRESNLVITTLPANVPASRRRNAAEYVISSYETPMDVAKARASLRDAFEKGLDFWDVNEVDKEIPYKEQHKL